MKKYLYNILIGIDQLVNAILGGDPDETISSRIGKHLIKHPDCPICNYLCKLLNLIDPNHCQDAIEHDEGKNAMF